MKFNLTTGWEDGTADLTKRLVTELKNGKKVFWLLSGGSNIGVSVDVMDKISIKLSKNLTIGLADERYGELPDYPESNWTKLMAAGFKAKQATLKPLLKEGLSFEQAVEKYQNIIVDGLKNNDLVLAQLGIGEDGHIAGILPDSPAALEIKSLVCGYQSQPFLRLTLTFKALKRVDIAYVFAFGKNKFDALSSLASQDLQPIKQPAQILKQIPKVCIYNDQIGQTA